MKYSVPYLNVILITFVRYHSQAKRYVQRGADKEAPLPMRDASFRHHARVPKSKPEDPSKRRACGPGKKYTMSNALVDNLIQQGDASIQKTMDEKNDAAADAVARLFSLVNAGKLDVSILDNLIAFAENPTSLTGAKALGGSNSTSDEQAALNLLLNSGKLQDNVKKCLEKLVKGELQLDNDGNPITSSAAPDPKVQQELTDLRKKVSEDKKVLGDIAGHFSVQINTDGSVKDGFAKNVISASDKQVADAKAAPVGNVAKAEVMSWAEGINNLLAHAKKGNGFQGKDNMIIEHTTFDDLKAHADKLVALGS